VQVVALVWQEWVDVECMGCLSLAAHDVQHPSQEKLTLEWFNTLSAMVAIWRHITVSFQVFGTERDHWNLHFLGDMHQ
jgi:hypothetical protein